MPWTCLALKHMTYLLAGQYERRAHRGGKRLGLWFMPPIDWFFGLWQVPDHCKNAYIKEFARKNYLLGL